MFEGDAEAQAYINGKTFSVQLTCVLVVVKILTGKKYRDST